MWLNLKYIYKCEINWINRFFLVENRVIDIFFLIGYNFGIIV